jgi:ornithine decarboxylase
MNENEDQFVKLSSFYSDLLNDSNGSEKKVLFIEKELDTSQIIEYVIEKTKTSPSEAFYIINLGDIIKKVNLWNELFEGIHIRYAVKSNPDETICKLLGTLGVGFDVASIGELKLVKNIVEPNKIIYANPVKDLEGISYARTMDVDLLVVDSVNELLKINLFHPNAEILIRIKVDDSHSLCKFSGKFGIDVDEEDIQEILTLAKLLSLKIVGVCFHIGSLCKNAEQYYKALQLVRKIFDIAAVHGFVMNTIDIGGGMPGSMEELDLLKEMSVWVNKGLYDFFGPDAKENLRLLAEPGRFIVSSSHTLVVKVIGKKIKKNKNKDPPRSSSPKDSQDQQKDVCPLDLKNSDKTIIYTLNDGRYGSFNCITYDHQNPTLKPYNNNDKNMYNSIIFGNTCDSFDTIASNTMLPELEIGDMCYVENSGAYTRASSTTFNGFKVDLCYVIPKGL